MRTVSFLVLTLCLAVLGGCNGESRGGGLSPSEIDAYNWHAQQSIDSAAHTTATVNDMLEAVRATGVH